MKQQNFMKLKNLIILVGAILLFGACTDTYSPVEIPTAPETPKSAVIVNTPDEAISGELMIKFRPEVTELLNRALTRSSKKSEKKRRRSSLQRKTRIRRRSSTRFPIFCTM